MAAPTRRRGWGAHLFSTLLLTVLAAVRVSRAARTIPPSPSAYVAVFDAGSTGTRVHVYRYDRPGRSALPRLTRLEEGGAAHPAPRAGPLSAAQPGDVPALLAPLLDWAGAAIPPGTPTEAVFLATAGLRALPRPAADALVSAAAGAIRARGGRFVLRPGGAAVLAGADEAALAWAAANAAAGSLEGGRAPTTGIVELGGASLQVAFEVEGGRASAAVHDAASLGTLRLGGGRAAGAVRPRTLYARSFEGLGHEAAAAAAGVDGGGGGGGGGATATTASPADRPPCHPPAPGQGPPPPPDPFARCQAAAAAALAAACGHSPSSPEALHCPLPAVAKARPPPRLDGVRLVGLENLAHTARFLGVGEAATLHDVADAGKALCAHGRPAAPASEAARHCFGAAYAVSLLHDAFGVGMNARTIDFSGSVKPAAASSSQPISPEWAAGAALVAAAGGSSGTGGHPFASGVLQPVGAHGTGRHHLSRAGRVALLLLVGGCCSVGVAAANGGGPTWPAALAARARRSLGGDEGLGDVPPSGWSGGGRTGSTSRLSISRRAGGGERDWGEH